jgi:ribonuclease P protein component
MLSQKHRLSKSADVKKTTARGRSFFNPYFVIKTGPNPKTALVTVVVSVRVSKKAVERNRIKRVMRDELRKHIARFKPGNYAFLVKTSVMKINSSQLREEINKSLTNAKILNPNN